MQSGARSVARTDLSCLYGRDQPFRCDRYTFGGCEIQNLALSMRWDAASLPPPLNSRDIAMAKASGEGGDAAELNDDVFDGHNHLFTFVAYNLST